MVGAEMNPRQILKYPGSKWRIAERIISLMPDHHSYLEPYFGSGAVFFKKPPARIETINDMDDDVINFFSVLRSDPERLAREISLTPYARMVYERALIRDYEDDFQRAVAFLIRCDMSHGFRTTGERIGWKRDIQGRENAYAKIFWDGIPAEFVKFARRLKEAQIEHQPALDVIQAFNYPNVLIYADPPYVLSTRCRKIYPNEMTDQNHIELIDALKAHRGRVILSGYGSELYDRHLKDWHSVEFRAYASNGKRRTEKLWLNFERTTQLCFAGMEGTEA